MKGTPFPKPLFGESRMSGKRTSGTSSPSLGAQVLAVFAFISWGRSELKKCLGKRLEVPDILLPDIRALLTFWDPPCGRAKTGAICRIGVLTQRNGAFLRPKTALLADFGRLSCRTDIEPNTTTCSAWECFGLSLLKTCFS